MISSLLVIFIVEATSIHVQLQTKALAKHTTALLIEGASELTMGQSPTVMTSHRVRGVLENRGHQ